MLKKIFSINIDPYSLNITIYIFFIKIFIKNKKKSIIDFILQNNKNSLKRDNIITKESINTFFEKNKHIIFNNMKSKISIIITIDKTSNKNNIISCIDTIINQTLKNIDIIIVNTFNYELDINDDKIKIVSNKLEAMKYISGEYIAFIDTDNYFNLETYEILLYYSAFYNLDIITFDESIGYTHLFGKFILDYFISNGRADIMYNKLYRYDLIKNNVDIIENTILFNLKAFINAKTYMNIPIKFSYKNSVSNLEKINYTNYKNYINDYINNILNIINKYDINEIYKFYSYYLCFFYNEIHNNFSSNINIFLEVMSYFENKIIDNILSNKLTINSYIIMNYLSSNINHYYIYEWFKNKIYLEIENINLINFINAKISDNTVLVSEFNNSHGEVIPGIVKYFLDLNYNVDILITNNIFYERISDIFNDNNKVKIFSLDLDRIKKAFNNKKIKKYKNIFITSYYIYNTINNWPSILDYIPNIYKLNKNTIIMEHHIDLINRNLLRKNKKIAIMHNLDEELKENYINPHYFGDFNYKTKNKDITKFIVAGSFSEHRRNYKLLFDSFRMLVKSGIINFHLTLVGGGDINYDLTYLRPFVTIRGRINYPDLFEEVYSSDFILPMLDCENKAHNRYVKYGVSGTFQLSYGFNKICIVNSKFSKTYGLDNDNSIIYEKNQDLLESLKLAINMEEEVYKIKQMNLKKYSDYLYNKSLQNLKNMLKLNKKLGV
ncbi:glycosyltransferase family A protein [Brachyspira innocens]|uniref:glycosyltransferase family A protein n=1 Tax=Brachyspira innocens TaxID=13264 RepID=UPI0003788EFF|nr:glycosyltransferase family A protein [Brachyspira innocens]